MRPLPQLTPTNEWFWTSGADGRLRIQRCDDCQTLVHPPVPICPACRSRAWAPTVVSGRGDRRRVHRQPPPVAARLRAAVRDRDRRARRGPDGAPHDERRRLRPGRRPHRPGGDRSASSSTTTCGSRCSNRPAPPTRPSGSPSRERPAPRAPLSRRSLRAPRRCSRASAVRRSAGGSWSTRSR